MVAPDAAPANQPLPGRHAAGDTDRILAEPTATAGTDRSWLILLAAAVMTFSLGLVVLAWPKATLTVVAVLLGIQLLVFGIARLLVGLVARSESGGTRAAYVILGVLGFAAGLYCIRHLSVTVVLLGFIVGSFWALHGVVDLIVAAVGESGPGRWLKAAAGVVSLAAGLLVMFKPKISLTFILVVLGAWLMLYGLLLAVWASRTRRAAEEITAVG
jgi:uncharacterized membrane protein HdeD (DUF308 family)